MLRHQEKVPSLPVPALDNLWDFLNWIKPIVSDEEFQASKEALSEFLRPDGDGEKLQRKLVEVSKELDTSWLPPFWNDMYLEYRGELVCNKNYYAVFENTGLKSQYTVSTFAAKFIYEMMKAYVDISLRTLSPEFSKNRPLCMDQYNHIFKAVRLPRLMKDVYKTYPFDRHHHIIVYYRNNIFKVTTSDAQGNILSVNMLASKIQSIIDAGIEDRGDDAGVLTTADRDNAARLHEAIEADSKNKYSLDIINTAVFVLCIDPTAKNLEDFQKQVLLSNGKNRYFDKNCQIIISENFDIAINNEHTGADAIPWFSIIDRALNKIVKDGEKEKIELIDTSLPEELDWHLSDDMKSRLQEQLKKHQEFADNIYVDNLILDNYGRSFIRTLKMSPDAFFHIALQIAQYKTFGRLRSTYESVAIRYFKDCRTECARAVNEDVSQLAMEVCSGNRSEDRLRELIINAQNAHMERIKKCQSGLGIERHLFVLYKLYEIYGDELGIHNPPKLYDSPGYKLLTHDFFSTSGVSFESISLFGFGPVVEDGYGIGYVINNDKINVSLSTQIKNKDKAIELLNNLNEAFLLLVSVMSSEAGSK